MDRSPFWVKARLLPLLCLLVVWLAAGCRSNSDLLQVQSKNFDAEIEPSQNLVFTFNQPLVPDSLLHRWDSTAYLSLTPKVRGQDKWSAPNELIFSPARPFAPSTDYLAELRPELVKHSEKKWTST